VPLIFVAGRVLAVGRTFEQYGLGGVIPDGQTIVAPLGTDDRARVPAVRSATTVASRLTCEIPCHVSLRSATTPHGHLFLRNCRGMTDKGGDRILAAGCEHLPLRRVVGDPGDRAWHLSWRRTGRRDFSPPRDSQLHGPDRAS
jgi:hypothetical protein